MDSVGVKAESCRAFLKSYDEYKRLRFLLGYSPDDSVLRSKMLSLEEYLDGFKI